MSDLTTLASVRLAIVLSHPTQYYSPWFRSMRATTPIEFRVFYLWDAGVNVTFDPQFQTTFAWDVDLLSGYTHEFVPNTSANPGTLHFGGLRNPDLLSRLNAYKPTALLIFGYNSPSHLRVIAWARRRHIPMIFRGDSHLLGRERLPLLTRLAARVLYAQFAAVTYVGEANRAYFARHKVPPERLFFAPHAVDATLFDPTLTRHREAAQQLRASLGIPPSTRVVMFIGKLSAAKQPRALLSAFTAIRISNTTLVFVGDGEEKSDLLEEVRRGGIANVHFLPFTNQQEIPSRYLAADVFALPSSGCYETWGLAVNEAMQMGLPCLVSDRVGCQLDLVTDNETGWVFRTGSPAHLHERLRASLTENLGPLRQRVIARIAGYSYDIATRGLIQAMAKITVNPDHH